MLPEYERKVIFKILDKLLRYGWEHSGLAWLTRKDACIINCSHIFMHTGLVLALHMASHGPRSHVTCSLLVSMLTRQWTSKSVSDQVSCCGVSWGTYLLSVGEGRIGNHSLRKCFRSWPKYPSPRCLAPVQTLSPFLPWRMSLYIWFLPAQSNLRTLILSIFQLRSDRYYRKR